MLWGSDISEGRLLSIGSLSRNSGLGSMQLRQQGKAKNYVAGVLLVMAVVRMMIGKAERS